MKNSENPFFSIVIPNYNSAAFIGDSIASVINQSFTDFELIIIDGCSFDGSQDVINKYLEYINVYLSEPDSGQSEALNKGFSLAKGRYFFWLNSDDILLPYVLQNAFNILNSDNTIEWVSANTIYIDKNDRIIKFCAGPKWIDFFIKNTGVYAYGPTTIFSKKIYKETYGFDTDLKYTMDTDLWLNFFKKGYKFKKINSFFWGFRIHDGSKTSHTITSKPSKEFLNEVNYLLNKHNTKFNVYAKILFKFYKFISGCYIKSFLYLFIYRNKAYTRFKFEVQR